LEARFVKHACQYAILRFLPFAETGEFANSGLVLVCPDRDFFGYRLATQGWKRIGKFFDGLEYRIYRDALRRYEDELRRVTAIVRDGAVQNPRIAGTFVELTRHREGLIQFAPARMILTENPDDTLEELFQHYVHRNFLTKEYQESVLTRRVRQVLNNAPIIHSYREEKIGDEVFHVTLPFVCRDGGLVLRAIKPLHLAHDDPSDITDHGATWLERLRRLRRRNYLNGDVLLPLKAPDDESRRAEAFREIRDELATEFLVTTIDDTRRIIEFANSSTPLFSA
jgi:hypothetical protein